MNSVLMKDVILDTDTYNEVDDQFALSYLLKMPERIRLRAITAAPFHNSLSSSPKDGMEKSYREIFKVLHLAGREDLQGVVYPGATDYMQEDGVPVETEASRAIVRIAEEYSPENPLYVVGIGAITNVASALLSAPHIAESIVLVWLGGHLPGYEEPAREFNMVQDIRASRVLFASGAPLVWVPALGVTHSFTVSEWELRHWLLGKSPLGDYLAKTVISTAEGYAKGKPWTRPLWDVCAVAYLVNDDGRFLKERRTPCVAPDFDMEYHPMEGRDVTLVYHVNRDALMEDLIQKLLM